MKKFFILHPLNGVINTECSTLGHSFTAVAEIDAVDLSDAFYKAQNDFNEAYSALKIRSTCIGDILFNKTDGIMYMCEGSYFSLLCQHEHLLNESFHGAVDKKEWNPDTLYV